MQWWGWWRKEEAQPVASLPPDQLVAQIKALPRGERKRKVETIKPGDVTAVLDQTLLVIQEETQQRTDEVSITSRKAARAARQVIGRTGIHPAVKFPPEPETQ